MKNRKILIICIITLLIILLVIICIIMKLKKKEEEKKIQMQENPTLSISLDIKKIESESSFFTVEDCINNYLKALDVNSGVYNLLSEEYIKKNNITESNVLEKVNKIENGFGKFIARKMYYQEIDADRTKYYIYGEVLNANYSAKENIYIMATLDYNNMTYSITPYKDNKISENEYLQIIDDLLKGNTNSFTEKITDTAKIVKKDNNSFTNVQALDRNIINYYMEDYVTTAVYYTADAYKLLDEDYKNNRFKTLEKYQEYINKNKETLLNYTISEYSGSKKEDYTQYIVIDTMGNYYIFKIKDIMEYSLILDFYTVEIEEVSEKYNESNTQEKVTINIQKVISALNCEDYEYVYNKLSLEFRENYYPTLSDFTNYISGVFEKNLELSFKDFSNEGEINIYNIVLEGTTASNNRKINMQIIMKLKDENDFVMSFNIK